MLDQTINIERLITASNFVSLEIVQEERWNNHKPFWKFKHWMTQGFILLLNNSFENKNIVFLQ